MYENYAKLRDQSGMSDYEVAKEIGVSRSVFSDWKSGRHTPSKKNRFKISQALGLPPTDYFFSANGADYLVETVPYTKPPIALSSRTSNYTIQLADGRSCQLSPEDYQKLQEDIDIYIESWLRSKKLI